MFLVNFILITSTIIFIAEVNERISNYLRNRKYWLKKKLFILLIKTMKFYLGFIIIVICFLLSSLGNDDPIKNGQLQNNQTVETFQTYINNI